MIIFKWHKSNSESFISFFPVIYTPLRNLCKQAVAYGYDISFFKNWQLSKPE